MAMMLTTMLMMVMLMMLLIMTMMMLSMNTEADDHAGYDAGDNGNDYDAEKGEDERETGEAGEIGTGKVEADEGLHGASRVAAAARARAEAAANRPARETSGLNDFFRPSTRTGSPAISAE
eukprot:753116-Pyramimonas_sp.AAC.1